MHLNPAEAERQIAARLEAEGIAECQDIAWSAVWLEACGYGGVALLAEALDDERRDCDLTRGLIGLDLDHVSCAFLAPRIIADVKANGRVFLRNVRHGLFVLPFTVRENVGIGCPVDPAFAVGGERHKNPYDEKLALAAEQGLEIDNAHWAAFTNR